MKRFYYRVLFEIIWQRKKIKLMLRYRTFNLENVEPADYEDLANF